MTETAAPAAPTEEPHRAGRADAFQPGPFRIWPLLPLFIGSSIGAMNATVLFIVLPPLGRTLGFAEWQIGLLYAAAGLMAAANAPFWGRRADRWGRKRVLLIGLFGYALDMAVFSFIAWLALGGVIGGLAVWLAFLVLRLMSGTFASAGQPAAQAYIADVTTREERAAGLALLASSSAIATILGPVIGAVAGGISILAPAVLPAVAGLANGVWASLALKEPPRQASTAAQRVLSPLDPAVRPFLIVLVITVLGQSALPGTLAFLVQDRLALDATATTQFAAIVLVAVGASMLVTQLAIVRRFRLQPRTMVLCGIPALGAAVLVNAVAADPVTLIAAGLLGGVGFGMTLPGIQAAASLAVSPHQQGALGGLIFSAVTLAFAGGPLLATTLYGVWSSLPFLVAAALMGIGWTIFLLNSTTRIRRTKPGAERLLPID